MKALGSFICLSQHLFLPSQRAAASHPVNLTVYPSSNLSLHSDAWLGNLWGSAICQRLVWQIYRPTGVSVNLAVWHDGAVTREPAFLWTRRVNAFILSLMAKCPAVSRSHQLYTFTHSYDQTRSILIMFGQSLSL